MTKKKTLPTPHGTCWCGCGEKTDAYFRPGHDKKAESMLLKLTYGPQETVALFMSDHGYGPNEKNLFETYEARRKNALAMWADKNSK